MLWIILACWTVTLSSPYRYKTAHPDKVKRPETEVHVTQWLNFRYKHFRITTEVNFFCWWHYTNCQILFSVWERVWARCSFGLWRTKCNTPDDRVRFHQKTKSRRAWNQCFTANCHIILIHMQLVCSTCNDSNTSCIAQKSFSFYILFSMRTPKYHAWFTFV